MAMATADVSAPGPVRWLGGLAERVLTELGDLSLFVYRVLGGTLRRPVRGTTMPIFYSVGVLSIPVVAVTGMFIGMVLAIQSYSTLNQFGFATRLGAMINVSVVRELGPVLAAVMLAGRIGGSMAAELATMRITEQIDALSCLGVNPVHYLAVPRFLACVLLIPLLTIVADFTGVLGGALVSIHIFHIEPHYYWKNTEGFVNLFDVFSGLIKSMCFGAAIAVLSCYRGFNSGAGAEGVGKAATRAFVASFIAILALDFFLGLFLNNLHDSLWPR
jgi:phospholipid/cholesterol/gamma-HCH transport system permease protein